MYQIIQKRKIWLILSGLAVGLSIAALAVWGLNFGIDFTGGSLLEVKFSGNMPEVKQVRETLQAMDLGNVIVQPVDNNQMIIRFRDIGESQHQQVMAKLGELAGNTSVNADNASGNAGAQTQAGGSSAAEELRFDSVGPSIGQELKNKSVYAIIIVVIVIALYIAWSFRKISKPIASWKYGIATDIALFHDVLIVLGVFAVLGRFAGMEINTPFVAAILTVLGYSVNDTIVVFDRVRENLPKSNLDFEGTVNASVNETLTRSVNTSFTTMLALLAILFFGGATIRDFALALAIGVFVGTYSSIFLASPVLVIWEKMKK